MDIRVSIVCSETMIINWVRESDMMFIDSKRVDWNEARGEIMLENMEVAVLSEQEEVKNINQASFLWRESYKHDRELVFQRAYEIVHKEFATPLRNCRYQVNERVFIDSSFIKGETVEEYPDDYEIFKDSLAGTTRMC